jgi:hypothetical protein
MPDEADVMPVAAIFDHDEVPAFLRDQPSWWKHGVHGFKPPVHNPDAPTLWTFSRPAKAAFEAWQDERRQHCESSRLERTDH